MIELPHASEPCTGTWGTRKRSEPRMLVCDICGQEYRATDAVLRAALEEVDAGLTLHDLAARGKELLAKDDD